MKIEAPTAVPKLLGMLENAKDDPNFQKTLTASSDLIMRNPQYGLDIANMLANVPPAQQTYLATVLGGAKAGLLMKNISIGPIMHSSTKVVEVM